MTETDGKIAVDEPNRLATGASVIAAYLPRLPNSPGVYRMLGAAQDVLYVGKAASLRKRVQAYTKPYDQPARIARMIASTVSMEFVQTASEVEALLLEANLIKRLKFRPRGQEHHRRSFVDHPRDAAGMTRGAGVVGDAGLQVPRLADVKHRSRGVEHAVDARRGVERGQVAADGGVARRGRSGVRFGHRGRV